MHPPSPRLLRVLIGLISRSTASRNCYMCQKHVQRSFHVSKLLSKEVNILDKEAPLLTPELRHQRYKDGELVPRPLNRPLGFAISPQPGQNAGRDDRNWKQKKEDYIDYEKHKKRRDRILDKLFVRSHFHDIGNIGKEFKGKSILSPSTPFKATHALYFPNLQGRTLVSGSNDQADTTPAFKDRVTIVNLLSGEWAASQTRTFTSLKENPGLYEMLDTYAPAKGVVQMATVNIEPNWMKAALIRLFWGSLRRSFPKDQHHLYFLNRRGMNDEIRDALGIWNDKVGYVYLLDGSCRVRWAGNGNAREEERRSLTRCVQRLVDEARGLQRVKLQREDPRRPSTPVKNATAESTPKVRATAAE